MINKIIIEGPDCVGKSTIIHYFLEITHYRYDVFDRGDISNAVYAEIYNRSCNYHRLSWKDTITFVFYRNYEEAKKFADAKNEILTEEEFNMQTKLFEKYAEKLHNFYGVITNNISGMLPEDVALFIKQQIEEINNMLTKKPTTNYYKQMIKTGCDKLKLPCKIDGIQAYINNEPVIDDIWIGCFGKISSLNDVDNIANVHFAYFCGYDINNEQLSDINEWCERPIDLIYVINSKLAKRPEVENMLNILITKGNFVVKSNLLSKLFGNDYINLLKKAKATIYVGSDLISFNALTARLYESLYAQNIIFFEEGFDANKYFKLCFGKYWVSFKDILTINKNNMIRKIKTVFDDKPTVNWILSAQNQFIKKLLRKAKIWE